MYGDEFFDVWSQILAFWKLVVLIFSPFSVVHDRLILFYSS